MIHHCTVYRKDTGEIVQYSNFTCTDDIEQISRNFFGRLLFFGPDTHDYIEAESNILTDYVRVLGDVPVIMRRPEVPYQVDRYTLTAGTGDYITITGLHSPCELVIDDPDPTVETWSVTVEDGGFEFEAEHAGVYTIQISRYPFLPATLEFTASWP